MGIGLDVTPDPRIWVQTLDGQISRRDHSTIHLRIAELRETGGLLSVIVDARKVRDYPPVSLLREIWNDGLEVLSGCPVAFLPPRGHNEELEQVLQTYVAEWDVQYQRFSDLDDAVRWCAAELDARAA